MQNPRKIIAVIILCIALGAAAFLIYGRIISPEDTWLCENDSWVKHGNPTSAKPTSGCGEEKNSNAANANALGESIANFQECADAGYPIQESYPRKCLANGDSFTEDIGNELEKADMIVLDNPRPNVRVRSPLTITGRARGEWFFEAEFPITFMDMDGNVLGSATARAESDWMTTDFVPFTATLNFVSTDATSARLILSKDNPSGLPELNDELIVPLNVLAIEP
ncbi:MAG: Gmad2 immunoglobulin-like domain-containing protein [Patescibacteria group bacterium]